MKKVLVAALLAVGISAFAQEAKPEMGKPELKENREKLSSEQRTELYLKKLTLELDLKENQQKEMQKIISEEFKKREVMMAEFKANREKGVKPTADDRFKQESQKLDNEIAVKEKVKKVLTPEQFTKWEDMRRQKQGKMGDRKDAKKADAPKPEPQK
jgi:protein CpxP